MLVILMANGQQFKLAKAEKKFNDFAFADAIASYERLVEKGYASEEIFKKLGNANYLDAKYKKAAEWYTKLFDLAKADVEPEYIYRYSQCLKSIGKYEEAHEWMAKFEKAKSNDSRAIKFAQNRDYLLKIKENSGRYDIENIAVNSKSSDFAPSFLGDMLVFSTARDSGIATRNLNKWNNTPFLNLYSAKAGANGKFSTTSKFSKNLNTKTHESSTAFTKDGKTIYFTRNNSKNGKFARDVNGISRLKIFRATKQGDDWVNIEELPFNDANHSTSHPALSHDGKKLYFASDMEGTLGESDIFVVDILKNGEFGIPKNLGNIINTEGKETFPFVTDSNVLYFSSDGHPGLGGLDVFAVPLDYGEAMKVTNVGAPVNGAEDDFSFVINESTKKGYFASDREGGIGSDDIYAFVENIPLKFSCNAFVEGTVKQKETGEPLVGVKVVLYSENNEPLAETVSGSVGAFSFEGECSSGTFRLVGTKEDYLEGIRMISMIKGQDVTGADIEMTKKLNRAPVGTNLAEYLNIARVYFDYNKSFIRKDAIPSLEKIQAYMNAFPDVKIQIRSHTDSRGSNGYNMRLSTRRAKATIAHLLENGINSERVSGEGFGETQLTNHCSNGVKCSEEMNQQNRRSEFIIVD